MSLQFDQLNNQLKVNDASNANAPIVLQASGTGATQAQLTDSTTTGGNARGTYATDFQKSRSNAAYVASGSYSFIGAGQTNKTSGSYSAIVSGSGNQATQTYSMIVNGNNSISTAQYSTIVNGSDGNASGNYSFIGNGSLQYTPAQYTFIGSGDNNTVSGDFGAILGGRYGTTRGIVGMQVLPACSIPIASAAGISQSAILILARQTTNATATVLCSDNTAASSTNQVIMPDNSAYYFKGRIIAGVTGAGNTAAWTFEGAIKRGAGVGTTAIVGTVNTSLVARDAGASTCSFTATADTTNGGLAITVTGQASTTIRWVCKIETTEMTY
jgi:hypothetical protein